MIITKIALENFRGFINQEIKLHPKTTLFVGVNGVGKTTCLDAITISLSFLVSGILNQKSRGQQIKQQDVKTGKTKSTINIETSNPITSWSSYKNLRPERKDFDISAISDYEYVDYRKELQQRITETEGNLNIPIYIYYSINRAILDIPLRIRKKHKFHLLEAYEGALTPGVNFRSFFEWFRNREDFENEQKLMQLERNRESGKLNIDLIPDKQLEAVRRAIKEFMPGFDEIKVRRNPLRMTVNKDDKPFLINQLSDGEKCTLALIGDLARRLAIANPILEDPLQGEGIVLIDEIELHLHPGWQRTLVRKLQQVFPKCQFILSTHSPQAIGELPSDCIRILSRDSDGNISCSTPQQALGLTTNEVLEDIMSASIQSEKVAIETKQLFDLIDQAKWNEAEKLLSSIRNEINGSNEDLAKAESLMTMLKASLND